MNNLIVVEKSAQWDRLKQLVVDGVSSPITRRVYSMALNEFYGLVFQQAPRPGFTKGYRERMASIARSPRAWLVVDHYSDVGDPQVGGGGSR